MKTKIRAKVKGQSQTSAIIVDSERADAVAEQLRLALSRATPVDTGRASRNWDVRDIRRGTIRVNNSLDYVQYLNQGSSQQAPARFVENTVDAMRVLTRGDTGRLIHATRNRKPGWKYGQDGFVYTYDPNKRGSELQAKKRAMQTGANISNAVKALGVAAAISAFTTKKEEEQE